ncbi:MAG: aminopeptidase P family N-terminal domain-containing protein [Enterocloster clostridioformis]
MESSADKLEQFVKACDLADKRIGVEMDYLTVPYYNMIREKFPEARLVDISDLFVYARSIKTEEEIKMFRELCRIADHGFTQVSRMAGDRGYRRRRCPTASGRMSSGPDSVCQAPGPCFPQVHPAPA